jgi:GNAT superfamily N-acetyltransferase
MMAAAEKWIREKGIEKIAIRSNVKRIPAHKFYEKNGYHIVKQQMIFNKLLKP